MVFPRLNVARGPVVQKHIAKDHLFRFGHAYRAAHVRARTDDCAHFQLDVETLARAKAGHVSIRCFGLAVGPNDICAADNNRARATVVSNRDVQPIRRQRVFSAAEHCSNVHGVLFACVEISVFCNKERHVQFRIHLRDEAALCDGLVVKAFA